MRYRRLGYVVPIALACLVAGLSGCSKSDDSAKNQATDGKTTITLWWNVAEGTEDDPRSAGWYRLINTYMKDHPDIRIKTQSLPYAQLKQKLTNSLMAGNPPDVVSGLNAWLPDFYRMGALPDLTSRIKNWPMADHIYDSVWSALTIDHKIVAFPLYIGIRATLYHQKALDKAGIPHPPKTWKALFADVPKLKANGVKYPYGIATDTARGPQELAIYLWGNDLSIVNKQGPNKFRNDWQSDPDALQRATEVFAFYKHLLDSGAIGRSQASWKWRDLDQNLVQGNVAMAQDGNWIKDYQERNPKGMADLKVGDVPVYKSHPMTFLEVTPAMTFKKSRHREAAIAFLKWVESRQAQSFYAQDRSPRRDVTEKGQWGEGFSDLAQYGRSWPPVPLGGIRKAMSDAMQRVLIRGAAPRDTAIWLSRQINQSLDDNGLLASNN